MWLLFLMIAPALLLLQVCKACPPGEYYSDLVQRRRAALTSRNESYWRTAAESAGQLSDEDATGDLSRRWYSAKPLGADNRHRSAAPWPMTCPGEAWIRYCFKNERSMKNLLELVKPAILRWQPAAAYSSMNIQPDLECDGNYECICGPQENGQSTADDALQIYDGRDDEDSRHWNLARLTYLGYNYASKQPGRHQMIFGNYGNVPPTSAGPPSEAKKQESIMIMMHELGHAIGLMHEHQRPDRDRFLMVNNRALQGYVYLESLIMEAKDPVLQPLKTAAERMNKICEDVDLTMKYIPINLDIMRADMLSPVADTIYDYPKDGPFDFGSIMIYDSRASADPNVDGGKLFFIRPAAPGGEVTDANWIYTGGDRDPKHASISHQDVKRVARLYPGTPEQEQAVQSSEFRWKACECNIDKMSALVKPAKERISYTPSGPPPDGSVPNSPADGVPVPESPPGGAVLPLDLGLPLAPPPA